MDTILEAFEGEPKMNAYRWKRKGKRISHALRDILVIVERKRLFEENMKAEGKGRTTRVDEEEGEYE